MSNKNYDVELNITYDDAYKHYIPIYNVAVPPYLVLSQHHQLFEVQFSFDEEGEENVKAEWIGLYDNPPPVPWWLMTNFSGVYSKAYFRNPHRDTVTFTPSNCGVQVLYNTKAAFEIQWDSTGFAANSNPSFKVSTVQKGTYKQYEWDSVTVYYKESTDENYLSVPGTISGSWSDYTIGTNLTLLDNVTYDVYVEAVSDDSQTATTPVAQFTTADADAVATCISPVGAFLTGDVTFVWSHSTEYGTPQYAYDLQYSNNNGASWTTVASHVVTTSTTDSATITDAGVYKWRVRTYNSNDVVGEWAEATFVNQVPANPPTNLQISTKGRPTVSWTAVSQSAYQVQFLLGDSIAYDSGAVYTSETSHFVNQYFDDTRSYTVRVRIYNSLGEISDWVERGYQQPLVTDVEFDVVALTSGGATITVTPKVDFVKYFVLRNNKLIAEMSGDTYTDLYANGLTNYSVVGVTSGDQSDIQTKGVNVKYPHATLVAQNGETFLINKRVNATYEIQTTNEADANVVNFIGDSAPSHYASQMRVKSFRVAFFDRENVSEALLGQVVFYADQWGNGGYCIVRNYDKIDGYARDNQGYIANEVNLTLEVTNYDDSIEYPL